MEPQPPSTPAPNILIVDDTPANLKLLAVMLKERGYEPRTVTSGERALAAARLMPPDLILLDVAMPVMDGFEVCQHLKSDADLKDIPILFISALTDTMVKVKAFRAGGDDYITKPFRFEEVEARVRTQLELRRQRRELQMSYEQLRRLEGLRDNLTHMVVHDMRSLLMGITAPLELAIELEDERVSLIGQAQRATARLNELMQLMLDVSRLESGGMPVHISDCELDKLARSVIDAISLRAGDRRLTLSASEAIHVECDSSLVRRILENLVNNALKFTHGGGTVGVSLAEADGVARVTVRDTGCGIPPDCHQKIFEKFGQVEGAGQRLGTGLGLTFCKLAVTAHGGEIGVESEMGQGSSFWFTLPNARVDKFIPDKPLVEHIEAIQ
jgi:two-component system sensor histidine kinase/response regulator